MRRLAAQQPQIRTGHTLLSATIGAGEFAIALMISVLTKCRDDEALGSEYRMDCHFTRELRSDSFWLPGPKKRLVPEWLREGFHCLCLLTRRTDMIISQLNRNPSPDPCP